jgi:hypothetical protein
LAQVDYVGSSGYGKEYMNLFNLQWGASDIADAVSCVEGVAKEGLIDPKRLGITRHSAGAYATILALLSFPIFVRLVLQSQGFQEYTGYVRRNPPINLSVSIYSRFALRLALAVGKCIIEERSRIQWTQNLQVPILTLSKGVDGIVSFNQANLMVDKMRQWGQRRRSVSPKVKAMNS